MKKVFLDDLPRYGEGKRENKINWKESVEYKVKFIYDEIEDEIEIIDYYKINNKVFYLKIKYDNNFMSISINNFTKCNLGELLGINTKKHKYNIGDIIKTKTGKIEILEQIRILDIRKSNIKAYKYKCLIDGNIDQISESGLNSGHGCNVCSNRKVLKGVNDLWTTHPKIAKLLKEPEIGYKISYGKTEPEILICPVCGFEKSFNINSLIKQEKFPCPICSDGFSYPEKFGFSLFNQLKNKYMILNNFIYQYSPDWIKPKRYDFYFELNNKNYIVEMDGALGHGNGNILSGQTAEETKILDEQRDKLANKYGIEVIRIDCLESELEYIRNNILNSKLNDIFDLSKIDWLECHKFSLNSRVKEACDLWNGGIKNTLGIGNLMKLNSNTIVKYLKQGVKIGWCDYNPKEVRKLNSKIIGKRRSIPIIQLSFTGEYIAEFESASEAGRQLNIFSSSISVCCRDEYKSAGGFRWMYKEDYYNRSKLISITPYKLGKKIICLNNNEIFDSIALAQRKYNIAGTSTISKCCSGKRNSCGKHPETGEPLRWMYYDEYIKKQNKGA